MYFLIIIIIQVLFSVFLALPQKYPKTAWDVFRRGEGCFPRSDVVVVFVLRGVDEPRAAEFMI